jgi:hypothetical protein
MRTLLTMILLAMPLTAADTRLYELRVYWAAEGKLDALHARFRDHTVKLFEKHGMTNIGYWVPVDNADSRLIYVVAHKDKAAADASWKAFIADPDWKKASSESEKNGKLVAKIERFYLNATDFSPLTSVKTGTKDRVFELRTYIATPNNLDNLQSRFRDHTVKLFEKHGITNIAYWTVADDKATCSKLLTACCAKGDAKSEAKDEELVKPSGLVYLVAHASDDARKKSFDAFRMDPTWVAAKDASEKKGGGSLTVKDGVKSLMLKATDYSPMK